MKFKRKLYLYVSIGMAFMAVPLYLSIQSMKSTNKIIDFIVNEQFRLSELAYKLDNDIKINNSDVLTAIILNNQSTRDNLQDSFTNIKNDVDNVGRFLKNIDIEHDKLAEKIDIIRRRVVGYEAVNQSINEALNSNNTEDIEDALLGFSKINKKFSEDTNALLALVKNELQKDIHNLRATNADMKFRIFLSFSVSFLIIFFSIYKLIALNSKAKTQLKRAEDAEREQRYLKSELAKYNDDLEKEIEKKTEELHSKIYTSYLSGLPNRNQLLLDMQETDFIYMAILDIDKFQQFNDIYGEDTGNIALRMSADFINKYISKDGYRLYHITGDEFVIAVEKTNLSKIDFITAIEQLLEEYKHNEFRYEDEKFNLIMSAGLSFSGASKMLAYADMALKNAKKKNISLGIFEDDKKIEEEHIKIIECYNILLRSFENNTVISYFQPILPLKDKTKPKKYESLVRIMEEGRIMAPVTFIDVAKKHRLYQKLTQVVVENTLDVIQKYKIPCSINISVDDVISKATLEFIYKKLDSFEYNNLITIELLETEDFKDYEEVLEFCKKIRSYGAKIALDDFGSGYSNFSHALNLPIDYIKIDSSIISNIDRDKNSQIMVETIVDLAQKMKVETIAEFVSSVEILETVRSLGVDYAQGFYIGKPEPITYYIT
ncbi:bifunctional diguanylate cyclase/phosphodiesterase [Sulfurimonas sp. HSL-1716]|uniref:EAL domain-containing protein n=1 Tax=Hydrocurvibacter sulfurireducens TaxID=3131937 RepID=UPI0031F8016D